MHTFFDFILHDPEFALHFFFLIFLISIGIWRFLSLQARRRLMEDTPTSRIRSAAQGYVELIGKARMMPGTPILSPLSHTECVWWRFQVEKREEQQNRTRWIAIRKGVSDHLFLLDDETGTCIIDPEGALVEPVFKRTWLGATPQPGGKVIAPWMDGNDYRYTEELILPGEQLYTLGWFTSLDHLRPHPKERLREVIIAWKNDPMIRQRFDQDGNGQLDIQEFERLREAAWQWIQEEQKEPPYQHTLHLLRADPQGRPFILTTHDPHRLARLLRLQSWLWLAGALIALAWMMHQINQIFLAR